MEYEILRIRVYWISFIEMRDWQLSQSSKCHALWINVIRPGSGSGRVSTVKHMSVKFQSAMLSFQMAANTVSDINANFNIATMERTSIPSVAVNIPYAANKTVITRESAARWLVWHTNVKILHVVIANSISRDFVRITSVILMDA
ncbi:hypothetical protein BGAL_0316g00050 [Botrytis galanthina]|uniref:Uncharacterized protein n=1 Tax=Botrytis galanthina TaxID=278940 RepID=A0A4S8QST2_9HELO|nr:hypothetical protein BGAL_0316g00050 [Botrytis galanthina]